MPGRAVQAASADEVQRLCQRLQAFNQHATGQDLPETAVHLAWHDAQGQLRGGILGDVCAGWLSIQVLWVDEDARGMRVGALLLSEAEARAGALGAIGAMVDTFDWQAEGFYVRQGYDVFGRLDDCPRGHQRIYLRRYF